MPRVFYGPHFENNSTYVFSGNANLGRFPLGDRLILPDGRVYRFALNDSTVEVAGRLYQSVAPVSNHTNVAADVARAINAVIISATLGGTLAAIDIYAEGLAHINDAGADTTTEGYSYRIKRAFAAGAAHAAVAASGIITVNLAAGEAVQVALTTNSEMSFTRNRYHQVLITAAPPTGGLAGVSPGVCAADRFYWSQTEGYAAVLASGTLLAGLPVMAGITTAGSVENLKRRARSGGTTVLLPTTAALTGLRMVDQDGTTTDFMAVASISTAATANYDITGPIAVNAPVVGMCIKANATTEEALIELAIP